MKKVFIQILLILLSLNLQAKDYENPNLSLENQIEKSYPKPPYDSRLDIDPRAKEWYKYADEDDAAAYNIGYIYKTLIKDYKEAEYWYKKALSIKIDSETIISLGIIFEDIKKYDKAIFFYKSAYLSGNKDAIFNLGLLYKNLKEYKKAEIWYKKAIEKEDLEALKNLSILYYHHFKDNKKAVKYYIALTDKRYPKEKIIRFFKTKWKIDDETIKKGYEEQLKADDIPERLKYKGGL